MKIMMSILNTYLIGTIGKIGFIDFDQMFKYSKSDPDVHKTIHKYGFKITGKH